MKGFLKIDKGFFSSAQLVLTAVYNFLLFFLFLFNRSWGMGVTLFEIAHLVPVMVTTTNKSKAFYAKIILTVLISLFFWTRADSIIRALSLLTVIGLNLIIFQEARSGESISPSYLFKLPFIWLEKFIYYTQLTLQYLVSWHLKLSGLKKFVQSETIKKVIVGVVISMPIIFILIVLFSSADQNFQNIFVEFSKNIRLLLSPKWIENLNWLWVFGVKSGLFWLYLCLVFPYKELDNKVSDGALKNIIEKLTVGTLVAGIFAVFIVTQFKTISFILDGFTSGQLNPSLFVREGFFQLLMSTIIGLGVFHVLKKDLAKHFLTLFLLIEIFLVSLVAGERVWLYQYQFGLTQARVWGIFFLSVLISVIVALFLNLRNILAEKTKWQTYILSFAFLVLCMGLINVDHLIATFRPPIVNNKVDIYYMARNLSWDGADLWIKGLSDVKSGDLEYKYNLVNNLRYFIAYRENNGNSYNMDVGKICSLPEKDWLSVNISVLKNKKQICDNYPTWMDFKVEYERTHGISNKQNTSVIYDQNSAQPFKSCRTLNTKMVVGADGKGEIGCDIEVNGQINLLNSYCEGQKSHISKLLIPDAYQRPNRYYATLTGLDLKEEVKVYVYSFTGSKVECLPSLNK